MILNLMGSDTGLESFKWKKGDPFEKVTKIKISDEKNMGVS